MTVYAGILSKGGLYQADECYTGDTVIVLRKSINAFCVFIYVTKWLSTKIALTVFARLSNKQTSAKIPITFLFDSRS